MLWDAGSSPTDEVPGCFVSKSCISDEADAGVEEGGRDDAQQGSPLHLGILSRVLDCVLQI